MPTESAQRALEILRDGSATFQWYVVPIFVLVVYVYAVEIEKRNWNMVFCGLALWGMDWINEIWNSLVFHFNGYAPVWGAPADTAYLILVGLNIEICFMFAILGIVFAKMLPPDKNMKILGIPNRPFFMVVNAAACVLIEVALNKMGALTWDYSWWSAGAPYLIFLIGYLPFFIVAFIVYDMKTIRAKAITVGAIYTVAVSGLIVFGCVLKWI